MAIEAIKSFPRYEHYKDSGVEWIGEIPEHWSVSRFKNLYDEINERSKDGSEELLSVSHYTGVTRRADRVTSNELLTNAETLEDYKKVSVGDLVSNIMLAWNGSLGISIFEGITSPAYAVYRLKEKLRYYEQKYFHYLLRTDLYKSEFKRNSSGIMESRLRLYTDDFFTIYSVVPPALEQTAIAQFLDHKTAQIDRAIAIKEAQIALLNERKQIMIQEAVTKGLDPTVPMKDSGVEWIGEIPAHWEVKPLRFLGYTQNGVSQGAEYFGFGFPFVSYSDVYNNSQLPTMVQGLANSSEVDRKLYSVCKGDVFFTRTSETIEEIGISSTCLKTIPDATFSGFLIRFRPTTSKLDNFFSSYFFSIKFVREFFSSELNLVTRVSLNQGLLKKLPVLLPPKPEQEQISEFLDQMTAKLNQTIFVYQNQIQTLKEYKTTLINEAVTGKIKIN